MQALFLCPSGFLLHGELIPKENKEKEYVDTTIEDIVSIGIGVNMYIQNKFAKDI